MRGILVDENGNAVISNGHLTLGDNRMQCVQQLIGAYTGEYKHAPILGGNAGRMLSGIPDPFWAGDVRKQLDKCGIGVKSIRVDGGNIIVEINN